MPKTSEFFGDDVHYTDKGAEFVAKRVFEGVEAASVLGPSAPKAKADARSGVRLTPATRNGGGA
jgi:hypothetical protein